MTEVVIQFTEAELISAMQRIVLWTSMGTAVLLAGFLKLAESLLDWVCGKLFGDGDDNARILNADDAAVAGVPMGGGQCSGGGGADGLRGIAVDGGEVAATEAAEATHLRGVDY